MSNCSTCGGSTQSNNTQNTSQNPTRTNTSFIVQNQGKGNVYNPIRKNANTKSSSGGGFADFAKNYGK